MTPNSKIYESTTNNSCLSDEDDPTDFFCPQRDLLDIMLPITIIDTAMFIIGGVGNIIICIIIPKKKKRTKASDFYLYNLSISDLILIISSIPQEIYKMWIKGPYKFGNVFCIMNLATETSINASVLTVTLFTMERFLAVCHPFVSYGMSKVSRAKKHIALLWIVSLGLALPQALQFGIKIHTGVPMSLENTDIKKKYLVMSTIFSFFMPGIIITTLYTFMAFKLYRTQINQNNLENNELKRNFKKSSTQSTKKMILMQVAVVVTFFICWTPFHAQRLIAIYGTTHNHLAKSPILSSVYLFMSYTSGVFCYMSTCLNLIVYHFMSDDFRETFKKTILQCCCPKTSPTEVQQCYYTNGLIARDVIGGQAGNSDNAVEKENLNSRTSEPYSKKQEGLNVSSTRDEITFERCKTTSITLRQEFDPRTPINYI